MTMRYLSRRFQELHVKIDFETNNVHCNSFSPLCLLLHKDSVRQLMQKPILHDMMTVHIFYHSTHGMSLSAIHDWLLWLAWPSGISLGSIFRE